MLKKILGFLIGRRGEIFNSQGEVQHQLPEKKWARWQSNYGQSEYNWRSHTGIRRGV